MRKNKFLKNIMTYSVISTIPILSSTAVANADSNVEVEFNNTINKYNEKDVVVENGVSIKPNETLDLSQYPGWEMSNDNTVEIDENGVVYPIKEGTVFLSNEINNKVHIIEVYVSNNSTTMKSYARTATVDRSYYKVFIDPGHGGNDNGASGFGYLEDELNLQISKAVESKLKQKGIEVKMSRTTDTYLSLSQRAQMANNYGADVFVSIHQNAAEAEAEGGNGIETYYHTNKSTHKPLSTEIQNNAIQETGAKDRGVKSANLGVLRETTMPSSLFESGFISNQSESQKLADPVYQDKLASAIANGVETYLKDNINLTGGDNTNPETPDDKPNEDVINTGIVTASSLNVRSGAGSSYSKIGSLSKGAKVEIVATNSGWYKIKYNSGYGYVSADYIDIDKTTIPPITPETPDDKPNEDVINTGIVTASSLNVRSGAGSSYSKIGSLTSGAKVEIVSTSNGWHKIKYSDGYGYVSADYIKLNQTTPETPDTKPDEGVINTGVVTATSLNVRSGYGTSYSKIGSLSKGAKVEIVESKSGWYKIKYNNGYGYVSSEYINTNQTNEPSTPEIPPTTEVIKTGVVNASSLNVRSGYGTSYSKVGSLSKGAKVEIVESKSGWYKIKYNNGYGYVSAEYINTDSGSNSGSGTTVIKTGVVTASSLNVRSGYGTSYSKIGSLSKGAKVEIVESKSGWYKIKYNNGYGYVSSEYIQ